MENIDAMELFYWVAFLVGLAYALVGVFAGGLGLGGQEAEVEQDVAVEQNGEAGGDYVSPFNSLTIAAFSATLGALGLIGYRVVGLGAWLSFAGAFAGALVAAMIFFWLVVRPLYRSESSSAPTMSAVVRAPADVITTIPALGTGEIVYLAGGSRSTMPARSETGSDILMGTKVAILRVRRGVAYVVPLYDEQDT
jgi:hypothetical protein